MKTLRTTAMLLVLSAGVAIAQPPYLYQHKNEIGIYLTESPTADNAQEMSCYQGAPGVFTAYVVVTNPWNNRLDRPIDQVMGFEFRLEPPVGVAINAVLPPEAINFMPLPDYFCAISTNPRYPTWLQVHGSGNQRHAVLMSLTVTVPVADTAALFIEPVSLYPSYPGFGTIADAEDDGHYSLLHPVSGGYDAPVFGLFDCGQVVPTEEGSWGGLKSLYR